METHLKNGDLSEYGFSCGYVQREKHTPIGDIWMYKENNSYHVRTSKIWDSFDTLEQARKRFAEFKSKAYQVTEILTN